MMTSDPDRVVAAWLRSGTAFGAWEKGEVPKPEIGPATYRIPVMCNPGAKDAGDKRFDGAWTGAQGMFRAYRAEGAPIGLAPDPRTAHECGDSRTLAIPFFDACLAARLPDRGTGSDSLKPLDPSLGWLAVAPGEKAEPSGSFRGDTRQAVWLPGERVAKAWAEYVRNGVVADDTPPPSPTSVKVVVSPDRPPTITWEAEADLESGLRQFVIHRDGKEVGRVPEKPVGKHGRAQFQAVSYHDTPERPWPEMRFLDPDAGEGEGHEYRVIAVNGAGLESTASMPAGAR